MSNSRVRSRSTTLSQELLGVSSVAHGAWCDPLVGITYYPPSSSYLSSRLGSMEVCQDQTNPGPPYRTGGPFYMKRLQLDLYPSKSVDLRNGYYRYQGKFELDVTTVSMASIYDSYAPTAGSYGAQAFKRFRPVQPRANVGQFLGELRDFPSMFKLGIQKFKDLGGQYLNYQFGWRPFLKDIMDFISVQHKIENHIRFVRNNNGKWMKRSGKLRSDSQVEMSNPASCIRPLLPSAFYGSPGHLNVPGTKLVLTTDSIWFSAMMKYYIQGLEVDSCRDVYSSKLLRKLYGFEINPYLAWQLIPFTWLQDWVANVGDVISNFSNSLYDNLVAKYAFVMRHRMTRAVISESQVYAVKPPFCDQRLHVVNVGLATPGPDINARAVITAECKERANATQWGFGNEGSSLSPRQAAILIALGISRGP